MGMAKAATNDEAAVGGPSDLWTERVPAVFCLLCAAGSGVISWWLVANGFLWATFYTVAAALLKRFRPGTAKDLHYGRAPDGYGRWSYNLSILHQAIILPSLALVAIWCGGRSQSAIDWLRTPSESLDPLSRQIFYSTMGAMAKDFWIYGRAVDMWLFIHHMATILGCALCMTLDAGGGLALAAAFLGELSSATYNLHTIRPCFATKCLQVVSIGSVNVVVGLASVWLLCMGNPWFKGASYFALCASLFSLRCVAVTSLVKEHSNTD